MEIKLTDDAVGTRRVLRGLLLGPLSKPSRPSTAMPPKLRGGKRAGYANYPVAITASPGDDPDESSGRNGESCSQDFELYVRSTLAK